MMIETSSYNDVIIETLVADIRAFKNRFFVKMKTFINIFGQQKQHFDEKLIFECSYVGNKCLYDHIIIGRCFYHRKLHFLKFSPRSDQKQQMLLFLAQSTGPQVPAPATLFFRQHRPLGYLTAYRILEPTLQSFEKMHKFYGSGCHLKKKLPSAQSPE